MVLFPDGPFRGSSLANRLTNLQDLYLDVNRYVVGATDVMKQSPWELGSLHDLVQSLHSVPIFKSCLAKVWQHMPSQ